jgi:hypothetical protein
MDIKELRRQIIHLEETLRQTWAGSALELTIKAKLAESIRALEQELERENLRTDKCYKLDQRKLFD